MTEILSFGEWVRRRRKALDLTQDELAALAGCSKELIAKIEGDARRPSKQIAALLATALQLDSAEHEPFVRAARAELAVDRLPPPLRSVPRPALVSARVEPVPVLTTARTNLPVSLTALIGRERELDELRVLLERPDVRLVTLTGVGGTGKTRLAAAIAHQLVDSPRLPDGVWFVDLAPVTDPALIASAILHSLGIPELPGVESGERLRVALRQRRMLVVLDNFEQVVDGAILLTELLGVASGVLLLVTSRVPLRLSGEYEYAVQPLAEEPALQLFIERARSIQPEFVLNDANAAGVAAICKHLDGLPLAIELAAARIRLFSPRALLKRLEEGGTLALLAGGPSDAPERQRTIRAAIAWSYGLLNAGEQAFFQRLGVFVGGFTEAAAVAVGEIEAGKSFELLAELVNQSMVRVAGEVGGVPRFFMLETLREYALDWRSPQVRAGYSRSCLATGIRRGRRGAACSRPPRNRACRATRRRRQARNCLGTPLALIPSTLFGRLCEMRGVPPAKPEVAPRDRRPEWYRVGALCTGISCAAARRRQYGAPLQPGTTGS